MRFNTPPLMVVALCTMLFVSVSAASAAMTAETFFPDTTKGFLVIDNVRELADRWEQTQFGQLMKNPLMKPFKEDMARQLDARMTDRLGLSLDGIEKLPSGELAFGMIAIPGKTPGFVFTLNVVGQVKETDNYLERLSKKLVDAGTTRSEETLEGRKMTVFTFPERGEPARATPIRPRRGFPKVENLPILQRKAYYILHKDYLVVSDQSYLLKLICDRMETSDKNSLSSVEDYQVVKKRCNDDIPKDSPALLRWYIEPLNYGESARSLLQGPVIERRKNKPSVFTILKEQGFDAIRGIGGVVGIKSEEKEVVHRTFIYAKKPFRLAMQMLAFPNGTKFTLPDWMPPKIARCTQVYLDPISLFDNFGPFFDALIMDGEQGVWADILRGLEEEENGPQINIRKELVVHLGQRAMGMSKYHLPITTTSESIVMAIELKEGKAKEVAKALEKLFRKDSDMEKQEYKSSVIWVRVPEEDVIQPFAPPVGPPIGGASAAEAPKRRVMNSAPAANEAAPLFPNGAFTVAKDWLFIGTNAESITEVLDRLDAKVASIKEEAEYKEVEQVFSSFGIAEKPRFLQFFSRTDETLRPTYEMIRQGTLPQSQAVFAKIVNMIFVPADADKPVRDQAIDGSKLPEFEKIRQHFGPAGFYGVSEENGFFFKGFLLEKKAAEPEKKAAEPEKKAVEPEKKAAEPEKKAAEPEKKAAEPEKKAAEPEKKAAEPEKKAAEPEKKTEK